MKLALFDIDGMTYMRFRLALNDIARIVERELKGKKLKNVHGAQRLVDVLKREGVFWGC